MLDPANHSCMRNTGFMDVDEDRGLDEDGSGNGEKRMSVKDPENSESESWRLFKFALWAVGRRISDFNLNTGYPRRWWPIYRNKRAGGHWGFCLWRLSHFLATQPLNSFPHVWGNLTFHEFGWQVRICFPLQIT